MVNPEVLIRAKLLEHGIEAFTTLGSVGSDLDQFVLMVRISFSRDNLDVNRVFQERDYSLSLQCFNKNGIMSASNFAEAVADAVEELYWDEEIGNVEFTGGTQLPLLNDYAGYSLPILITEIT